MRADHPHSTRIAVTMALAALFAASAGASQPATGPQATAKVGIRLSVRPYVRLAQQGTADRLCLWSNLGPGQFGLSAEWRDGRTVAIPLPEGADRSCARSSLPPALIETLAPIGAGEAPVLLMIEAR